jgi:hypothetical protein
MPADKYGKSLYKVGTVKSEKAAIANRDPARKAAAMKIMAREGTTSAAGGRPAVKMPAKTAAPKPTKIPNSPNKPAARQNLAAKPLAVKPTKKGK